MTLLRSTTRETCVHCGKRLRPNGLLRNTPCGRSIVFDPARDRVWIVCDHCNGWNLTPLDTRVDAIAECEGVFNTAVLRDTSGGVDRARVGKVDFVRIGTIADDGLALFRYSARVRRRERIMKGLGFALLALFLGGPPALLFWANTSPIVPFALFIGLVTLSRTLFGRSIVMRCRDESGTVHTVRKRDLRTVMLVRGEQPNAWWLSLTTADGHAHVVGEEALRVLRAAFAATLSNVTPDVVAEATRFLREARFSSPMDAFAAVAQPPHSRSQSGRSVIARPGTIYFLPLYQRVALDMASNDAIERAAAREGAKEATAELGKAERIAQISDNLFPPAT